MRETITVGAIGLALTREAIAEISSTLRQLLADVLRASKDVLASPSRRCLRREFRQLGCSTGDGQKRSRNT